MLDKSHSTLGYGTCRQDIIFLISRSNHTENFPITFTYRVPQPFPALQLKESHTAFPKISTNKQTRPAAHHDDESCKKPREDGIIHLVASLRRQHAPSLTTSIHHPTKYAPCDAATQQPDFSAGPRPPIHSRIPSANHAAFNLGDRAQVRTHGNVNAAAS